MSNEKVKALTSAIRQKLMQEATTLESNGYFKKLMEESNIDKVLFLIKFENNHIHAVLPDDIDVSQAMLKQILLDNYGIDTDRKVEKEDVKLPKRIVFHNRQAIGDILMFTCGIRDFKTKFPDIEVQVNSTAPHIWDHNKHLNRETWVNTIDPLSFWNGDTKPTPDQMLELNKKSVEVAVREDLPVRLYIGPGKLTNASNRMDLHFANAYRIAMEMSLGVQIPQGPIRPDIYMTEEEYEAPAIIEPPYWLITAGEKGDWTCKTFPFAKWQEVVEKLPQIKFVQLGSTAHKHPELSGNNVINFIGKTQHGDHGIRMLFNLFNHCEGSMGLVSFQMHLAAAFNKPCITIAGAREPVHFTRYPGQGGYLATDGCLPCTVKGQGLSGEPTACWFCSIERCPYHTTYGGQEVPLCADLFTSDDIVKAILRYYDGGRLSFTKPLGRSTVVNVVKTSQQKVPVQKPKLTHEEIHKQREGKVVDMTPWVSVQKSKYDQPADPTLWGFSWGGASITEKDWEFIEATVKEYDIKTVLEFGSGLSTLLFKNRLGLDVVTYESDVDVMDYVKRRDPEINVIEWGGITVTEPTHEGKKQKYDLAFVDGPKGGENREHSVAYAAEHADIVIVHDGGRAWERKWQELYLRPYFYLVQKGGNRCHLWKKGLPPELNVEDPDPNTEPEAVVINTLTPEKFEDLMTSDKGRQALYEALQQPEIPSIELIPPAQTIRFVFNGRGDGGAEKSVCWMMKKFVELGWNVEYVSPNPTPCGTFKTNPIQGVLFIPDVKYVKDYCDILFLYTNDWVWEFPKLEEVFSKMKAKRRVMGVNFKAGAIRSLPWFRSWDTYLFLNSTLREACGKEETGIVLPPPTDLSVYFDTEINYGGRLRIVRHSSQGDTKYPKDFNRMVTRILDEIVPAPEIFLMPAPSFLDPSLQSIYRSTRGYDSGGGVRVHKRNQPPVHDFLKQGNVFWYALPSGGYTEGGPKVIMEAQASGLPIVADNHSGAVDRLKHTKGTSGFLCNSFEDHLESLKKLNSDVQLRELMGKVNREHARKAYDPMNWIRNIIDPSEVSCINKLI